MEKKQEGEQKSMEGGHQGTRKKRPVNKDEVSLGIRRLLPAGNGEASPNPLLMRGKETWRKSLRKFCGGGIS